jgi:hypothetical protein
VDLLDLYPDMVRSALGEIMRLFMMGKRLLPLKNAILSYFRFPKFEPYYFSDLQRMLWLNASHNQIPAMSGRVFSRNRKGRQI